MRQLYSVLGHEWDDGLAAHGDKEVLFQCISCDAKEWRVRKYE